MNVSNLDRRLLLTLDPQVLTLPEIASRIPDFSARKLAERLVKLEQFALVESRIPDDPYEGIDREYRLTDAGRLTLLAPAEGPRKLRS